MSNEIVAINDVRSKIDFKKPINYLNHRAIYDNTNLIRVWKLKDLLYNKYIDNEGLLTVCRDDASWNNISNYDNLTGTGTLVETLKRKFDYQNNFINKITLDKVEVCAGNTNQNTVMLENWIWFENNTFNMHDNMVNGGNGLEFSNDTVNRIYTMTTYDADDGVSDQKLQLKFFYDTNGQFTDMEVWQYGTDNTGDPANIILYVTVEAIRKNVELPTIEELNNFVNLVDKFGAQNIPNLSDLWE